MGVIQGSEIEIRGSSTAGCRVGFVGEIGVGGGGRIEERCARIVGVGVQTTEIIVGMGSPGASLLYLRRSVVAEVHAAVRSSFQSRTRACGR